MKYLIAGLGNIGDTYQDTRHNIGFTIADALVQRSGGKFESGRYGDLARIKYRARHLLVLKPSTYMNLSGKAVNYWLKKESIPVENLLVIVDDLALPLGLLRLKAKGGDGGHNGLNSIIAELGSVQFARLRIGIGDAFARGFQVDYVLGRWTSEEIKLLTPRIDTAVEAIRSFVTIGPTRTMNIYNTKPDSNPETNT